MRNVILAAAVVVIGGLIAFLFATGKFKAAVPTETPQSQEVTSGSTQEFKFSNPKKSAHYETNTPVHGAVLAAMPVNVVIDFNFDLAKPSEIKILKDGKDYGVGETVIDANKLSLRRNMDAISPDGLYTVEYKACWPDTSCHEGNFQFAIDRTKSGSFGDETGQDQVTIRLSQTKFMPEAIRVSPSTKVTWINDDDVEHYVNTDSHPAHTYYPSQNSKVLNAGDSYSLVLNNPGIYPYHCSAHEVSMKAAIVVE